MAGTMRLLAILFVALCAGAASQVVKPPVTVPALNLNAYGGRWFAIYFNQESLNDIGGQSFCVTADYTLNADGTIGVYNSGATGSVDSGVVSIDGIARQVNLPDEPGQLTVTFFGRPGDYWIVQLGPIRNGLYDYAIITDPDLEGIFVIARDPAVFRVQYQQQVLSDLATTYGFQESDLIRIFQDAFNCPYAVPPMTSINHFVNVTTSALDGNLFFTGMDGNNTFCGLSNFREPSNPSFPPGVWSQIAGTELTIASLYELFPNNRTGGSMLSLSPRGSNVTDLFYVVKTTKDAAGKVVALLSQNINGQELLMHYRFPVGFTANLDESYRRFINSQLGMRIDQPLTAPCATYPPRTVDGNVFSQFAGGYVYVMARNGSVLADVPCGVNVRVTFNVFNSHNVTLTSASFETVNAVLNIPWFLYNERFVLVSPPIAGLPAGSPPVWIFNKGPLLNGLLEYVVLGTPGVSEVLVWARNVQRFNTLYRETVAEYMTVSLGVPPDEIVSVAPPFTCN